MSRGINKEQLGELFLFVYWIQLIGIWLTRISWCSIQSLIPWCLPLQISSKDSPPFSAHRYIWKKKATTITTLLYIFSLILQKQGNKLGFPDGVILCVWNGHCPLPEVVRFLLGNCGICSKPWSSSSCESHPGCSRAGAISFLPRQCSYLCASSNLSWESCNGNAAYLTCWYSSQSVADCSVPKQWRRRVRLLESSLKPLSFFLSTVYRTAGFLVILCHFMHN